LAKNVSADPVAYPPVQQHQFGIDRLRYPDSGGLDETTNVGGQFPERVRLGMDCGGKLRQ